MKTLHKPHANYTRWFFAHLFRQKTLLIVVFLGMIAVSISRTWIPLVLGDIIDSIIEQQLESATIRLLLLVLGLYILYNVLDYSTMILGHGYGLKIEQNMRKEFFDSIQLKPLRYHDNIRTGDLLALATNDLGVINSMISHGSFYIYPFIQVILTIVLLGDSITPLIAYINIPFIILYALFVLKYRKDLTPYASQRLIKHAGVASVLQDSITGAEVVRAFTAEKHERKKFREAVLGFRNYWLGENFVQAKYYPLLILYLATGLTFLLSVILAFKGIISVGQLTSANLLLLSLQHPTDMLFWATKDMMGGFAACSRVYTSISSDNLEEDNLNHLEKLKTISGKIEFQNVSFAYGQNSLKSNHAVLRNVTFSIEPNQRVALVGPTGCGKTTLAKLILNLYKPQEGQILLDGMNIQDYSLRALRRQIGYIEQDIYLFSRSIRENITFGNQDCSEDEIIRVAKLAQVDEFVEQMAERYDTIVGERGTRLSGGQKQRISIARAFLTNPKILILDDSVSAVDSETEEKIGMALENVLRNRTTLIITHRLHTIRNADKILVLKEGSIVAEGKHEDLLKTSEDYRRIFGKYI